jgi:hypothetical protein
MDISAHATEWMKLAAGFDIQLPAKFLEILQQRTPTDFKWSFLDPHEARKLMADLDLRFNYPGREWRGVPFARSTVSEDIACFDLGTPPGEEARVLPIRDWHGPRWEFSGETRTFKQWLSGDSKGHLN